MACSDGRVCVACDQFKFWTEFNRGNALNGHKSECRSCQNERARIYRQRPEVKQQKNAYNRKWWAKQTPERRSEEYQKRKEYCKEYQKEWNRTPAGKAKARRDGNKQYAWRKNLEPLTSLHIKVLEDYNRERNEHLACEYCQCNIEDKYSIDHVIPVSKGGDNFIHNLLLCCSSCNSRKNAKRLEEIFPHLTTQIEDILNEQRRRYQEGL